MKKTYIEPAAWVEVSEGYVLLVDSNRVTGLMDNSLDISYGGEDEDGKLDPSANAFGSWDEGSWDKLK